MALNKYHIISAMKIEFSMGYISLIFLLSPLEFIKITFGPLFLKFAW